MPGIHTPLRMVGIPILKNSFPTTALSPFCNASSVPLLVQRKTLTRRLLAGHLKKSPQVRGGLVNRKVNSCSSP